MKNRNNKITKIQSTKKKRKLFLICGAGILAATAISVPLAITFSKSSATGNEKIKEGECKITFHEGIPGSFETNSTNNTILAKSTKLKDVKMPIIKGSQASNFVGWAKTSDFKDNKVDFKNLLRAGWSLETCINDSNKNTLDLTAVFTSTISNASELQFATITFNSVEGEGSIITGNRILKVPSSIGIRFGDINQPSVTCPTGYIFHYWKKADGTKVQDTDQITGDLVLYAHQTTALTITFSAGEGGEIIGQNPIALAEATAFGVINKPMAKWKDTANPKYFGGWYKDEGCTKIFGNADVISVDTTAYAKWVDSPSANECVANAVVPTGYTWEYDTASEFIAPKNTAWKNFNHPNPKTTQYKVKKWQYKEANTKTIPTTDWVDVNPESTAFGMDYVWIQPVMITAIEDMIIADQAMKLDYSYSINTELPLICYTFPQTLDQTVSWKIYEYNSQTKEVGEEITDTSKATITKTDKAKATLVVKDDTLNSVYVEATSGIDETVKYGFSFTKTNPYEQKYNFFTILSSGTYGLEGLSDKTSKIKVINSDGTIKEQIERKDFNYQVYIGDNVTTIPDYFLYNCYNFNKPITRSGSAEQKPITTIGNNVLSQCLSYTGEGIENIASTAQVIGDDFLSYCIAFNKPLELSATNIGSHMLYFGSEFNSPISFNNAKVIGDLFLSYCRKFSQDITFPSTLTQVGDQIMLDCDSYVNTITMSANPAVFAASGGNNPSDFCTTEDPSTNPKPIVETGFTFSGANATAASNKWKTNTTPSAENYHYRTVKVAVKEVESFTVKTAPKTVYVVDDTFTTSGMVLTVKYKDQAETEDITWVKGSGIDCPWTSDPVEDTALSTKGEFSAKITYSGVELANAYTYSVNDAAASLPEYLDYETDEAGTGILIKAKDSSTFTQTSVTVEPQYLINGEVKTVTGIANNAFENCKTLTGVSLPNTLKTIGNRAFYSTDVANNFNLPNSLESIGDQCFYKSNTTSITVPANVKYLGINFCSFDGESKHYLIFSDLPSYWTYSQEGGTTGTFAPTEDSEANALAYKETVSGAALTKTTSVDVLPAYFTVSGGELTTNAEHASEAPAKVTIKSSYLVDGKVTTVKTIGDCSGMTNTRTLLVDSGITMISKNAFSSDNLTVVELGKDVAIIGNNAFTNTLTNLAFADTTKKWRVTKDEEVEEFTPSSTTTDNATYYNNHYDYDWAVDSKTKTTKKQFLEKVAAWVDNGSRSGTCETQYTKEQIQNVVYNGVTATSVDSIDYGGSQLDCSINITVDGETQMIYLYDSFISSGTLTEKLEEETVDSVVFTITDDYIEYVNTKATSGSISHLKINKHGYVMIFTEQDATTNYSLEYNGDPK